MVRYNAMIRSSEQTVCASTSIDPPVEFEVRGAGGEWCQPRRVEVLCRVAANSRHY